MTLEELAYGIAPLESGLYILYDKHGNFYYGSAVNLRYRLQNHHRELIKGTHRNQRVQRSFDKYGLFADIVDLSPKELLPKKEQELIFSGKLYAPAKCMNVTTDPYCTVRGISRLPEASIKSANTRMGQKRSDEAKARMSKTRRGKTPTEKAIKARTLGITGGRHTWFISPTGDIYGPIVNVSAFEKSMCLSSLTDVANGRRTSSYGWRLRVVCYQ